MAAAHEYYPTVQKIKYDPSAPVSNQLVFRHYNAEEVIMGKKMEDWLRFAVAYWHTMKMNGQDQFGDGTIVRPFDDGTNSLENAKNKMRAAFEFFQKLGVKYWCFHDRDIAPEGKTIEETNKNLDEIVKLAKELQQKTGVKCLWGTANMFSNPRFMNGASTNPDPQVFMYACAQVKKAMECTKELGGENYVFWGGREGYVTLLNTNIKRELDHMAAFMKMAVDYKHKIGFKGTLLIEPKPKEPTKHQYDYDAQTVMGFLKTYGLENEFKLNIEPNHTTLAGHSYEHDIEVGTRFGTLGSIDANTGDSALGWDTDQFPSDLKNAVMVMHAVVRAGGLHTGGLNFDAKLRRESTNIEDFFYGHICGMDTFAKALRIVAKIVADGDFIEKGIEHRYGEWAHYEEMIKSGKLNFEEANKLAIQHGEPKKISGEQEKLENTLNCYIFSKDQ